MGMSQRLHAAASAVRHGARVADIGADHAQLPVYLVKNGICPAAVAVDVRPGPAAAAARTVAAAGLERAVAVRIGDGLSPVAPDEVDDIVIAGMGGETIAAILAAAPWVRAPHYRLILQPMTKTEILHAFLMTNGFSVDGERLVPEGDRQYVLLTAQYTAAPPVTDAFAHWRGAFAGEEGRPYWRDAAAHLCRRASGCEKEDAAAAETLRELAARLRAL